MKLKLLFIPLLLCAALLLGGCDQAETPTPNTDSTSTTTLSAINTAATTTTPILLARRQETTTETPKANPSLVYTTLEDMRRSYHFLDEEVYRGEFVTSFYELCEYGEDPEAFYKAMVDLNTKRLEDKKACCGEVSNTLTVLDFITVGNLKKEDVVAYFEKRMLEQIGEGNAATYEEKERHTYFTYEEIDILFSGNDRRIKETFKTPWSVLADDGELYSFLWLVEHSVNEWIAAGITEDNIAAPADDWKYRYHDQYLEELGMWDKLEAFYNAD